MYPGGYNTRRVNFIRLIVWNEQLFISFDVENNKSSAELHFRRNIGEEYLKIQYYYKSRFINVKREELSQNLGNKSERIQFPWGYR